VDDHSLTQGHVPPKVGILADQRGRVGRYPRRTRCSVSDQPSRIARDRDGVDVHTW
jgi:hypothetical protein